MTQDEIMEMAEQAGWDMGRDLSDGFGVRLEAFTKLVAEKAAAKEREACAKVCEAYQDPFAGNAMADAIRARGET